MFDTPILFIIFNRSETAKTVLEKIREIRPKKLFIASDGWRLNKPGEKEQCESTRRLVLDMIDWECEVHTLFRENNLGAGKGVSTAITWFFEHVEYGIILEDDCLPIDSFFTFCQELLTRYQDDTRIMHVSGNNYQFSEVGNYSYFFSRYPVTWGWATWRRAWQHFDYNLVNFKKNDMLHHLGLTKGQINYYKQVLYLMKHKEIDCWDYQWLFACLSNNGLAIVPQYNLVRNIGFGPNATHTTSLTPVAYLKTFPIEFINHPQKIQVDENADRWHIENLQLEYQPLFSVIKDRVYKNLRNLVVYSNPRLHAYLRTLKNK
jgi:hypothetical protein